jgi:hypothetical protein
MYEPISIDRSLMRRNLALPFEQQSELIFETAGVG